MKKDDLTSKNSKKPWPTKKAMEQVYENNLWGGDSVDFYSGKGSHDDAIVQPYVAAIASFLNSFENKLTLLDLGCGDFNVGKQLVDFTKKYIAVDIVAPLIKHNKATFVNENLEFHCLDIVKDELPVADCVILRQVLQHLSNAEILSIVNTITNYKCVLLTEHIPNGDFVPNVDIISGQGTRLKKGSGVDLLVAPFFLKVEEESTLLVSDLGDGNGVIVTSALQLF